MKRGKIKSQASVLPEIISDVEPPPLDILTVKVKSLHITEESETRFAINITFYDQLILTGSIVSTPVRAVVKEKTVLRGTMQYDPSDYERMSIIAGNPLCVQIRPLRNASPVHSVSPTSSQDRTTSPTRHPSVPDRNIHDISCCNIDILPLFIGKDKKHVKKRMQPLIKPSILYCKSWDNLPLLNLKLEVTRNPLNEAHHNVLRRANWMQLTLIGAYNMLVPYSNAYVYTAASRLPLHNGTEFGLVTFSQGYRVPRRFFSLNFNPYWESLRVSERNFADGDVKFESSLEKIQNDDDIFIERYLDNKTYTTIWGSFHRTLFLGNADGFLWKHIRRHRWPLEVHIYGETRGYSFMAFLNLFKLLYPGGRSGGPRASTAKRGTTKNLLYYWGYSFMAFLNLFMLLYPGEDTVRVAVPLQWVNSEMMQTTCGCELLLTPNDKASSTHTDKTVKSQFKTELSAVSPDTSFVHTTGSDQNNAFVIVEVKLARPLKKAVIPDYIPPSEINEMLRELERRGPDERECTGRGQQDRNWQTTVKNAAAALRKVPYYGTTEFCQFNRQLSETRTRVELTTSCWQDAAVYINNNFVVQDFLQSDEAFEEMLMMAHACLMKSACAALVATDKVHYKDPTLRAARHARQMQDVSHAAELYLQAVVEHPRDPNYWRELSTCLKDVNIDWANVCLNKSVVLDPRHPLSLLSKGCMLFEEEPALAEPFFVALLALHPFWSNSWIIASVYYIQMELFHMADKVLEYNTMSFFLSKTACVEPVRSWESELGDWWDTNPILSGMSPYYAAADLLLRLRCVKLAEACVSLALCDGGETAAYYHLVALCCRLQENVEDALCHCQAGIEKYGEISYLRSLEAECYHKLNDLTAATASFEKAGNCTGCYSIILSTPCREQQRVRTILVDLSRRQPSAYVWMALALDWMTRATASETSEADSSSQTSPETARTGAAMCAIQALKWDRRASKAWALLAKLVKPSARRLHCMQMAYECGYQCTSEEKMETSTESKQSLCYHLARSPNECRCHLCENTKI